MPKSKSAKQRLRGTQETTSTFVAEQLKQHLFGKENAEKSEDDSSGDENDLIVDEDTILKNSKKSSVAASASSAYVGRDYCPAANKVKTQSDGAPAHAAARIDDSSYIPKSTKTDTTHNNNGDDNDDDVIYDEDEERLRKMGANGKTMMDAQYGGNLAGGGVGGGGGGGGSGKGGGKNLVGASAADAASGAGGTVVGNRHREKDQSERATVETVMDPRTRLILHKMVNSGIMDRVHGCVSTGKEANVYLGILGEAGQGIWESSQQQQLSQIQQQQEQQQLKQNETAAASTKKQQAKQNHFHPQQYTASKKAGSNNNNHNKHNNNNNNKSSNNNDDSASQLISSSSAENGNDNNNNKLELGDHPFKPGSFIALKIYKTSILVFKDREKYVAGEHRFQRYCKSNPRKMVRTWAEKESRNLNRLYNGGVPCPRVFLLRQHILAMEFLGAEGWPAPRLKDVRISVSAFEKCYHQVCIGMRKMFLDCRLVHGDLSEFNLLVCNGKVMFIDVSQSVEHDHPQSMDFLRRDIVNVHVFFKSKGVSSCMSHRELFEFITTGNNEQKEARPWSQDPEQWLQSQKEVWRERNESDIRETEDGVDQRKEDEVFLQVPVPRDLKGDAVAKSLANPDIAPLMRAMLGVQGNDEFDDDEDDFSDDEEEEEDDEDSTSAIGPRTKQLEEAQSSSTKKNDKDDDDANSNSGSDESDDEEEVDQTTPLGRFDAWCKTDETLNAAASDLLARVRQLLVEHTHGQAKLAMMNKDEKRLFQHVVKLEQRRKRIEKVPKHLKKRATKKHMKK